VRTSPVRGARILLRAAALPAGKSMGLVSAAALRLQFSAFPAPDSRMSACHRHQPATSSRIAKMF